MKRQVSLFAAALCMLLSFTQCNKEDLSKVFHAKFYTTDTGRKWTLYVNNVPKGELPYFATTPACGNYSDGGHPLELTLNSGDYELTARDDQGNVISSSIHISGTIMRSSSTGSAGGGVSIQSSDDCLTIGLFKDL